MTEIIKYYSHIKYSERNFYKKLKLFLKDLNSEIIDSFGIR